MQILKNKIFAIMIAILFITSMGASIILVPDSNAQTTTSTKKTYCFIGATPNPVGVGQPTLLDIGISLPLASSSLGWKGLTVTVTKPDGTSETLGPYTTDATGGIGKDYTPTIVGNYTLQAHFPQQLPPATASGYYDTNTTLLASDSDILTLVVQQQPIAYYPAIPLPNDYWTRPINAMAWSWASISGNWLTPHGLFDTPECNDQDAPLTPHMLWATPLAGGGLAGGEVLAGQGGLPPAYENGAAYEDKFLGSVIISGVLYYNKFQTLGGTNIDQQVVAVNLHTGEQLWDKPLLDVQPLSPTSITSYRNQSYTGLSQRLAFGQLFMWSSYNYQGVFGLLWTTSGTTWNAYDATTGRWFYSITNVPSGTTLTGPNGEFYRYTVDTAHGWMTLWNSSALVSMAGAWDPEGYIYNAAATANSSTNVLATAAARAWAWNITIPKGLSGSAQAVMLGDRVFGASVNTTAVTSWAFSLKTGQVGTLIFSNTWAAPAEWAAGNVTLRLEPETLDSMQYGVFVVTVHETRTHYGFSTTTGQFLWGPTPPQYYLDMYQDANGVIVDGYFISGTMSGIISCYNVTTGELLWKHGSTDYYSEARYSSNYPRRNPASFVSNGKIYTGSYEHSPNQPLPRGTPFECINETTGELIWTIPFYAGSYYQTSLMGDSIIAAFNSYDNRIYAMGKGPSSTTVQAPLTSVNVGGSLVIQGTVMDVSPGTKSTDLTLTFPNGVPAVSDASQTPWMQYVYYQFPEPTNATGVPVSIDAVDPNGNFVHLGNTTSDSSGLYSIAWTPPDVPGKYIVLASFAGSEAYFPSSAETAAVVTEAPQPTATSTPLPLSISDMYFIPAIAGLFVLVIAVAVVLAFLMLRKRP